MKTFLFFTLILFSIKGIAQIDVHGTFNPEKKLLVITLKNESNKNFNLRPIISKDGQNYNCMSTITFEYKDKNNHVLHTTRKFILYEYQHKRPTSSNEFLLEHQENKYKYYLDNWYKGNAYKVDIFIKIESRIVDLKTNRDDEIYQKEVKLSYFWE